MKSSGENRFENFFVGILIFVIVVVMCVVAIEYDEVDEVEKPIVKKQHQYTDICIDGVTYIEHNHISNKVAVSVKFGIDSKIIECK